MLSMWTNTSHPIHRLRSEIEDLLQDAIGNVGFLAPLTGPGARLFPAVNLWETDDSVFAEAEVPGLRMEDIEVVVLGDELTIKGEYRASEDKDRVLHRHERPVGAFSRVIHLPVEIDSERVSASMRDGVLAITMPKAPAAKPRKIEVTIGS